MCVKIREDGSVWDNFLKFFTKIGIQELSENLSKQHTLKSSHLLLSKEVGDEAIFLGLQYVYCLVERLVEVSLGYLQMVPYQQRLLSLD